MKDKLKIIYFNSDIALNCIYPDAKPLNIGNGERANYQITKQGYIVDLKDTLLEIVGQKKNFWFCYALANPNKIKLEDCEAYTFFSLKGKTIGETKELPKPELQLKIIDNTKASIFKKSGSTVVPSLDFTRSY
jgi:hypothetical protein